MLQVIYYKTLDLLNYDLISQSGQNYLDFLQSGKALDKLEVENLSEIFKQLSSQDIFATEVDSKVFLIGESLKLEASTLSELSNLDEKVILATNFTSVFKELKKLVKLKPEQVLELKKIDTITAKKLVEEYFKINQWHLEAIYKYLDKFEDYKELIDFLDILRQSSKPENLLNGSFTEESTPLFWLKFDPENLNLKDLKNWYKQANEEQIQLILSLIYGKVEKSNSSKKNQLIEQIIQTDLNSKTSLSGTLSLKLFLYLCSQGRFTLN